MRIYKIGNGAWCLVEVRERELEEEKKEAGS